MNKAIKVAVVAALGFAVSANVACSRKQAAKVAPAGPAAYVKPASEIAELKDVFGKIDSTYDYENKTLANKIEDVTLEDPVFQKAAFTQDSGHVHGTIKIKGFDAPVGFYSKAITIDQLQAGVPVETHGDPNLWEENVGGQVTGTVKCLDEKCLKVAVYFRMYQGAGYIFQLDEDGYALVNKN